MVASSEQVPGTEAARLNRSEELLASILENTIDAIISIDQGGRIESFNSAAELMFGYLEEEVLGQNVRILMPEPYHSQHDAYLTDFLSTRNARIIGIGREVVAQRKDGTIFPIELGVSEFRLDDGEHFTGIVRDITARKKMEEQLRQAQKMEAIGQLAGGIAHDFNNLLTVINGLSALLLEDVPDANRVEIEAIHAAGVRAAELTSQLLALSRKAVLQPRVVQLNEVIIENERLLRRMIGEDIEISASLAPNLPMVEVDPAQIGQVILNLAINARDAMPLGGRLVIETRAKELGTGDLLLDPDLSAGQYVRLSVTDSGSGMPAAVSNRVFEPFFTTKPVGEGTGLGLAVVHGIIKQSGGTIRVYSEENQGTVFTIYLPAVNVPNASPDIPGPTQLSVNSNSTILLAEDEDGVQLVAKLILERKGYTVLTAADGLEALAILEAMPGVDLVITDVVMPRMDGRQLAEAVHRLRPELPVLFISGYPNDVIIRRGILDAGIEFLQKPFTPANLCARVAALLVRSETGPG